MLSRRNLLLGTVAAAATPSIARAWRYGSVGTVLPVGFSTLPLGPGGFQLHLSIANNGIGVVSGDGGGIWKSDLTLTNSPWAQLNNLQSFGLTTPAFGSSGLLDLAIAPQNSNRIYQIYEDVQNIANFIIYRTDNGGVGINSWKRLVSGGAPNWAMNFNDSNSTQKFAHQRIQCDPSNANGDVVVFGAPAWTSLAAAAFYTLDAGVTWTACNGVPAAVPQVNPGTCTILFDASAGTTTNGGKTVSKNVYICVSGYGIYKSTTGPAGTFSKISSDATTPATVTVTTANANTVIIAECLTFEGCNANSVTLDGVAMTVRCLPVWNNFGFVQSFWGVAASPGAHTVTANWCDGTQHSGTIIGQLGAFGVSGPDTSGGASTIFSAAGTSVSAVEQQDSSQNRAPISISVTETHDFVYAFGNSSQTSADSGFTGVMHSGATNGFFAEYAITAGSTTLSAIPAGLGIIMDALKSAAAPTIDGTFQYATSTGSALAQPTQVWQGAMGPDGTLVVINGPVGGHTGSDGSVWRWNGSWTKFTNATNGFPDNQPAAGGGQAVYNCGIAINPLNKDNMITCLGGSARGGQQTTNLTGATPTFTNNNPAGFTLLSTDVPWLGSLEGGGGMGFIIWDPTDNTKVWYANGEGVQYIQSPINFAGTMSFATVGKGIEQLVAQDVIDGPGFANPIAVVEDRYAFKTAYPNLPSHYAGEFNEGDAWCGDCAWNTGYAALSCSAGVQAVPSMWTSDYGATWTAFTNDPMVAGQFCGNVAIGSYTDATHANLVMVTSSGGPVKYTLDNGNTAWGTSSGIPSVSLGPENRGKIICPDRDNPGAFYCYSAGNGVYRSTDQGATFSLYKAFTVASGIGQKIFAVPGHAGDVFLSSLYGGAGSALYLSQGGGAFADVSGGQFPNVELYCVGPQISGGTYPTIYIMSVVGGVITFSRSINKGTTWTTLGKQSDCPAAQNLASFQTMEASWSTPGKFYIVTDTVGFVQGYFPT